MSAMFNFGARHGFVTTNPVENASVRKTDNRRERFLALEEVSRLGEAFNQVEADGANPKAVAISRLWALTGCRRNEIAELKAHEVNLDQNRFEFDDTKTGKSIRPFAPAAGLQPGHRGLGPGPRLLQVHALPQRGPAGLVLA